MCNSSNLIIASQNNDSLRTFEPNIKLQKQLIRLENNEVKAILHLSSGKTQIREFYWGSTFQSQSSRYVEPSEAIRKVELFNNNGELTRTLEN